MAYSIGIMSPIGSPIIDIYAHIGTYTLIYLYVPMVHIGIYVHICTYKCIYVHIGDLYAPIYLYAPIGTYR